MNGLLPDLLLHHVNLLSSTTLAMTSSFPDTTAILTENSAERDWLNESQLVTAHNQRGKFWGQTKWIIHTSVLAADPEWTNRNFQSTYWYGMVNQLNELDENSIGDSQWYNRKSHVSVFKMLMNCQYVKQELLVTNRLSAFHWSEMAIA